MPMKNTPKTILNDYKNAINSRFDNMVNDIVLFGSQQKGNATSLSDYDILIILNNKSDWKTEREISDICYTIDLKYGILSDTHILALSELDTPRGQQPVFVNALNNGIHA